MADQLNIQLDGTELIRGANAATSALAELRAQLSLLGSSDPTKLVRAQLQGVSTAGVSAVDELGKFIGQISSVLGKAQVEAKASGKKVGKAVSDGMLDGLLGEESKEKSIVKQRVQALQAAYEDALKSGKTSNPLQLLEYKLQGVSLDPNDRVRVKALLDSNRETAGILATMRKVEAADRKAAMTAEAGDAAERADLVASAGKGLAALRARLARDDLSQQQTDANRTYQMRQRFIKAEEDQEAARAQMVARAGRGLATLRQKLADEANGLRSKSASNIDPRTLLGLAPDATNRSAAGSADVFKEAFAAVANGGGTQLQQLAASLTPNLQKLGGATRSLSDDSKELAARQRDVHSAFRGAAGAAGALFLTYGALIPLVTAFAVASTVKNSITEFKDLEYQLKFVQAVADDTTVTLGKMMDSVTASAREVGASPVEAAKGMRILAQAGLTSQEALDTLPAILRLSTVGELGMAQAAETATGAVNAFGLGIDNVNRVVDVFFKSAAISNTSVEKISESMKQASTIAQRYKLSVEDVGTALVAMAKRNITGSGAGTALTNLFDELAAPRGEAKGVARQLGIQLFDPIKGETKDFFEKFVPELREKLKVFDPESQNFILNRLTNNRGAKALSAILGLSDKELGDIKSKLDDATGSAARAVINLNDSVQGDLNKLKSAFQETLAVAGAGGADTLRHAMEQAQEAVTSPAFKEGLSGLVNAFLAVVDLAAMSVNGLARIAGWFEALPRPVQALMNPLGEVKRLLQEVGILQTDKDAKEISLSYMDKEIKKEEEYQRTLQGSIDKLREKMGLQNPQVANPIQDALLAANQRVVNAQKEYDDTQTGGSNAGLGIGTAINSVSAMLARRRLMVEVTARDALLDADTDRLRARAAGQAKAEEYAGLQRQAAAIEAAKQPKAGDQKFTQPSTGVANQQYQADLKQVRLAVQQQERLAAVREESERVEESNLKTAYETGYSKYDEYQKALTNLEQRRTAERIADAENEAKLVSDAYEKLKARSDTAAAAASLKAPRGQEGAAAAAVRAQFDNDLTGLQAQLDKAKQKSQKETDDAQIRQNEALVKALGPAAELVRNSEKELAANRNNVDQELQKLAVKRNGATLTEREAYTQGEILRITNAQVDEVKKLEAVYAQLMASGAFNAMGDDGQPRPEALAAWQNMRDLIGKAKADVDDSKVRIGDAADRAFDAKKVDDFAKSLNSTLADAIIDAGHDGGAGLTRTLEDELLRKPFKIVLQALMQPITMGISQFVMGGVNSLVNNATGTTGGIGGLSSLSGLSSIGKIFGGGGGAGTGAIFSGTMEAATGDGLAGTVLSKAALDGTTSFGVNSIAGAGSAASGAMSSLAAAAPYVAAALAVYTIGKALFSSGGGPRSSGYAGVGVEHHADNSYGADLQKAVTAYQDLATQAVKTAGGTSTVQLGLAASADPKGTAQTYVQNAATVNGQLVHFRQDVNVGRSDADLKAAVDIQAKEALVYAFANSDAKGAIAAWLRGIMGDGLDDVQGTYDRLQKAIGEKAALDARHFDLTATAAEKLAKARAAEADGIDETNRALLAQVQAEEDVANAKNDLVAAYQNEGAALKAWAKQLRDFVDQIRLGADSPLNVVEKLGEAHAQYDQTLAAASGGDADARGKLTGSAQSYLDAAMAAASSRAQYDVIFGQISSDLTGAATAGEASASMQEQQLQQLGLLNTTVQTWAQAWAAYQTAQAAAGTAKAAADAEASIQSVIAAATPKAAAPSIWDNNSQAYASYFNYTDLPGFASGGDFSGGLRLVGENGPEIEATGASRIWNAQQTRGMLQGGDELATEIRALREEVSGLRAEAAATAQHAYFARKSLKQLEDRGVIVLNNPAGDVLKTTT